MPRHIPISLEEEPEQTELSRGRRTENPTSTVTRWLTLLAALGLTMIG